VVAVQKIREGPVAFDFLQVPAPSYLREKLRDTRKTIEKALATSTGLRWTPSGIVEKLVRRVHGSRDSHSSGGSRGNSKKRERSPRGACPKKKTQRAAGSISVSIGEIPTAHTKLRYCAICRNLRHS